MNYELEINNLKKRLDNLQQSFIQAQKNSVPTTAKVDDTANKVEQITPYTETKTAYIGDTEVVFTDVKLGNLSVFGLETYKAERDSDRIRITFEPLEEVTEVTISIS